MALREPNILLDNVIIVNFNGSYLLIKLIIIFLEIVHLGLMGFYSLFFVVHRLDPGGDCFFLNEDFLFKLCDRLVLLVKLVLQRG